jgi:hypothetical protein
MQTLRHMTRLARLVLAGFLLSLGVAAAAPALKPHVLEMVCSGGVYKLVSQEGGAPGAAALDCPLCAPAGLPPVACAPATHGSWGAASLPPRLDPPVATVLPPVLPPARAPPAGSSAT